jgi:hypothetical protein
MRLQTSLNWKKEPKPIIQLSPDESKVDGKIIYFLGVFNDLFLFPFLEYVLI